MEVVHSLQRSEEAGKIRDVSAQLKVDNAAINVLIQGSTIGIDKFESFIITKFDKGIYFSLNHFNNLATRTLANKTHGQTQEVRAI